jgi:hypothetical protein
MKIHQRLFLAGAVFFGAQMAFGQLGPGGGGMGGSAGPNLGGSMAKLFGDNKEFSGNLEMGIKSQQGPITIPGKIAFSDGKSRFEMDLTQMKSEKMPPEATAQIKAMGMDKMVIISRPDKKLSFMLYPGLQAYVQTAMGEADAKPASAYKIELTELGKETVDGHPCIKNKAVVTDEQGAKHESTLWSATDLKKFPVKIELAEGGSEVTMLFKDVKLAKPEGGQFDVPSDLTKYDSMQAMIQQVMMKRIGGAAGQPPATSPTPK